MTSKNESDDPQTGTYLNVFISYQWKSQANIRKLYHELDSFKQLKIFMDIYRIKAGMNLYAALATNVQQADIILACVTREYVKSKNCEREIIYADAFNKPIIPLYIEKIPIPELGPIGFVLVRERYCNLYRNENVFDALGKSEEFKDIIDGIETIIKIKKLSVFTPLQSKEKQEDSQIRSLNETDISHSVINYRNDMPIEEIIAFEEKNLNEKDKKVAVTQESTSKPTSSSRERMSIATGDNKNIVLNKNIRNIDHKYMSSSKVIPTTLKYTDYFKVHPVIKELKFLVTPKTLLDPNYDQFQFEDVKSQRGGEPYFQPVGWIRYGLKVKLVYKDIPRWCANDGNPDEWAVLYHGFKMSPMKQLYSKICDTTGALNPTLIPSQNLQWAKDIDINKRSTSFGKPCGLGILASANAELAQKHTVIFKVNDVKYKMLLMCRADPTKIRIPKSDSSVRIVNQADDIRPYGILLREV